MANDFNFTGYGYIPGPPYNFNFGDVVSETYEILPAGSSVNFTSIWADSTASINTEQMYIGSAGDGAAFSVVNLTHRTLVDSYLIDESGQSGDLLDDEDIVDINVSIEGS